MKNKEKLPTVDEAVQDWLANRTEDAIICNGICFRRYEFRYLCEAPPGIKPWGFKVSFAVCGGEIVSCHVPGGGFDDEFAYVRLCLLLQDMYKGVYGAAPSR